MAAQPPPGRREADKLLVLLLRQNGCPVPEGVSSVGQLSSDAVIQAVGSMIAGISGSRPPPEALSTRGSHPAERYHACRLVANRVRDVGYAEPFSAHQLLYPGGEDTRALLLELLSMLPPEGALPPSPGPASPTENKALPEQEQHQTGDLLSNELPEDVQDAETAAPAVTGDDDDGGGDENDAPSLRGEGDKEQEGEGGAEAGPDDDADGASGGGDGANGSSQEGEHSAGSSGSSPEDVAGSVSDAVVVEKEEVGQAEKEEEEGKRKEKEEVSGQGPEEETPPVTAGDAPGDNGDEPGAEQEEEDSAGREVQHSRVAAEEHVTSPESADGRVDDDRPPSARLDTLEHDEEPEEAGAEEEEEEDNVFGPGPPVEVLGEEPAVAEAVVQREEEEDNVFGSSPSVEVLADELTVAEAVVEGEEEEEDNVFGSGPSVEVLADEPAAADGVEEGGEEEEDNVFGSGAPVEVLADEPAVAEAVEEGEGEDDNVFGSGPSVEVLVDESAVAETFVEGGEEEEDNVFGLTEPSEAVLGAKAAAREAFQDGRGQEEEGGSVVSGSTERSSAVSPGAAPAPTESFTEEEEEDEDNVFGPTTTSDIPLVAEPSAAELSKDEGEVLAIVTGVAEEGSTAGSGRSFPAEQETVAAETEGGAELPASDSDAAPAVGGRGAALHGESGDADTGVVGDGGRSLEAQEQAVGSSAGVERPGDAETAGLAGATKRRTAAPDSAVNVAPGEGDDEHDTRPPQDNGKRTAEDARDGVARAPDSSVGVAAGAGKGAMLLGEGGGGGGGGGGTIDEGRAAGTEPPPEGDAGRPEGTVSSGEGGEEGGEGRHEDAAQEDGEDDVVFLQFEVEAKELELKRLLAEEEVDTKVANELEEEVQRLGSLAEEQEKYCRYTAKALELLPNVATETRKMQLQCDATEARMLAARKAFNKTRKPLEAVVRLQREELARRKARCRALVEKMRSIYAECQEMSQEESSLKAAAREMEAWERRGRGEIVIGRETEEDGNSSSGEEWGDDGEDDDAIRRRKAGALLRMDIDKRITSLCENAAAQKQEIAISLSEVLDSRRDANGAWELLGRSEALPEEKLFAAAKLAKSEGGGKANKERTKDLIDAYKRLHVLGDVFSKVVEAVSEVARREEECRLVEDETEKLLSRRGGIDRLQLLFRDLKRVKEDAFALEQRLDQALEEDRLNREALEEERANQALQEEHEHEQDHGYRRTEDLPISITQEEEYGTRSVGAYGDGDDSHAWNGNDTSFEAPQDASGYGVPVVDQQHEFAAEEGPQRVVQDEEVASGDGRVGLSGASHEYGVDGDVDARSVGFASEDQEVDFVGEDEEDNVWQ